MNKKVNSVQYIQFLIHVFKVLRRHVSPSFPCPAPLAMICTGWLCAGISVLQAVVNTVPSLSKAWFYAFACQIPTHPIMSYFS